MLGYKVAVTDTNIGVLVTLEIPDDAITNIYRKNVVNINTAYHRTNKARVIRIEDRFGNEYEYARSTMYLKYLWYELNKTVSVDNFYMKLEEVYAPGIHFFLDRERAKYLLIPPTEGRVYRSWQENGEEKDLSFLRVGVD